MNRVNIIIPVHNRIELTQKCLESLYRQTYRSFKIIVFDDGSIDRTAEMIKHDFPDVALLKGNGNCWWSKSVNEGIRYALQNQGDYIITMNDDLILDKVFLDTMIKQAQKDPDALMGASYYEKNTNKLLYAGTRIDWFLAREYSILDSLSPQNEENLIPVDHLPGRGLWIPVKVIKQIGLFDEKYLPHYAADYDFTLRAARAGLKLYCNLKAKIYTDDANKLFRRNKFDVSSNLRKNIIYNLTNVRSPMNLATRWRFAVKNCPRLLLISYILMDTLRSVGHCLRKNSSAKLIHKSVAN